MHLVPTLFCILLQETGFMYKKKQDLGELKHDFHDQRGVATSRI